MLQWMAHTQECMESTKRSPWVIKNNLVVEWTRKELKDAGGEFDENTLYGILRGPRKKKKRERNSHLSRLVLNLLGSQG